MTCIFPYKEMHWIGKDCPSLTHTQWVHIYPLTSCLYACIGLRFECQEVGKREENISKCSKMHHHWGQQICLQGIYIISLPHGLWMPWGMALTICVKPLNKSLSAVSNYLITIPLTPTHSQLHGKFLVITWGSYSLSHSLIISFCDIMERLISTGPHSLPIQSPNPLQASSFLKLGLSLYWMGAIRILRMKKFLRTFRNSVHFYL